MSTPKVYDGRVFNLSTGQYFHYSPSLHPKEAVIAAYAQSKLQDFNTWDYDAKYGELVKETNLCYVLGDFTVFKEAGTP